jgi:hypothetical protein
MRDASRAASRPARSSSAARLSPSTNGITMKASAPASRTSKIRMMWGCSRMPHQLGAPQEAAARGFGIGHVAAQHLDGDLPVQVRSVARNTIP